MLAHFEMHLSLADALAAHFAFGQVFVWTWKVLQWPIAFGLVRVGIGLVYYFAPDAEQSWVRRPAKKRRASARKSAGPRRLRIASATSPPTKKRSPNRRPRLARHTRSPR